MLWERIEDLWEEGIFFVRTAAEPPFTVEHLPQVKPHWAASVQGHCLLPHIPG